MAGFVQIIEFRTSRIDELEALSDEYRDRRAGATFVRGLVTADRDHEGVYRTIVEFPSHEEAMANSQRPETGEFAAKMAELCDGPPTFYNLDVIDVMETAGTG
jgi:hypothetical protein